MSEKKIIKLTPELLDKMIQEVLQERGHDIFKEAQSPSDLTTSGSKGQ